MSIPMQNKGINGTLTKYEISFEYERQVGILDGIPVVQFFDNSPYLITKTITFEYVSSDGVEEYVSDYQRSKKDFLTNGTVPYIESVSVGSKLVNISGKNYFECSKVEVDFSSKIKSLTLPTTVTRYESGSCAPTGYYQGIDGPIGLAMFPYGYFSTNVTRKYIHNKSINNVGDIVDGIVSSIDKSNPRWHDGQIIYDFTETSVRLNGTPYK